jgi:dihydrofolate reductase
LKRASWLDDIARATSACADENFVGESTMRRVVYRIAASLDGFIAGPNGEIDWIVQDPTTDFTTVYSRFDSVLLGRRTYELTQQPGAPPWPEGWRIFVFSRTLNALDHPLVTVVSADVGETVADLRAQPGRDIWVFGGGSLVASLLAEDLIDELEVAVMPVLLGSGSPVVGAGAPRSRITLTAFDVSPNGIVNLKYHVRGTAL